MQYTDLKVFIVDDDQFTLGVYDQHLKNLGIGNVSTFSNGMACIDSLDQNPDIVFLDFNMEEMDGKDVLLKIKRVNPNIFVVMVSGQDEIDNAVDLLKYGAFDYLVKGKDEMEKMRKVIAKIIEFKDELERRRPSLFKRIFSNN